MAKMGEGDPRWLVAEIGSTNPGSWHWEAKSVLSSCQERLTTLFDEASIVADIPEETGSVKITKAKSITGEVWRLPEGCPNRNGLTIQVEP
jgi:hypothetical protein